MLLIKELYHWKVDMQIITLKVLGEQSQSENKNLYLKDFESLLVVFGYFVCSHQLNVVAISRVADNVILQESSFKYRNPQDITKEDPSVQVLALINIRNSRIQSIHSCSAVRVTVIKEYYVC